jgi:hypothetical protein
MYRFRFAARIIVFILTLATLLAQSTAPTLAQEPPDNGIVTVTPPDGYPGTEFHFTANGFISREQVSFWVNDPMGRVFSAPDYSVRATREGAIAWNWLAPTDAMSGTWAMVAEGVQSQVQRVVQFAIQEGTTVDPETGFTTIPDPSRQGVEPAVGAGGTQFHFFAGNFRQREWVSFWVNDPAGRIYGDESYRVRANGQGFADWLWVSSRTDLPGTWTMVAVGQESQVVQVIPFEITR